MKTKTKYKIHLLVFLLLLATGPSGMIFAQTHISLLCGDYGSQITGTATPLNLTGNVYVYSVGTGNNGAVIEVPVGLGNADRTFTVQNSAAESDLTVSGEINSSTHGIVKNGAGTMSFSSQPVALADLTINGGTLASTSGTMSLAGNFSNNAVFNANNGTVALNGNTGQNIGGTASTSFNNLTLNNLTGATLGNSHSVSGILTLANGLLTLGDYNLTLGEAAVAGTPGSSSMIVSTGTGECRRIFTANGAYSFPVGDATGTAEFSPITLNFTSGTYADAYAGVRVINAKHPNNASSVNYLNRYWSVTSAGISDFYCDVTGNYVPADIAGAEAAQAAGKYSGSLPWTKYSALASNTLTANGVTSFSDFTGITLASPSVNITANPGLSVCPGTSLTLTANPTGDPAISYLWSPGGTTSASVNPPTATPGTTPYSVTITDGNGFTASQGVSVDVYYRAISGTLKYNNAAKTPMNGVTLAISPGTATSTTNSAGAFTFSNLCDEVYTISVSNNPKTPGSINSTDAAQVNYWSVYNYNIEYTRFLAGDVYGTEFVPNYSITPTDALHIQLRFINGPTYAFPRSPWSYWKAGQIVGADCDLGNIQVDVNGANVTQHLYGQVTGDFNGSYIWSPVKFGETSVALAYGEPKLVEANTETDLQLRMTATAELSAVSLIFSYPEDLFEVSGVEMKLENGNLDWMAKGGELRVGWNNLQPVWLEEGSVLMTIYGKTSASFGVGDEIRFTLAPDPLNELADENFSLIPDAKLAIDVLAFSTTGIWNLEPGTRNGLSLESRPNPFANYTTLVYTLHEEGSVTIEITDLLGRRVALLVDERKVEGEYSVKLDATPLQPGVYMATLKLQCADGDFVKTIKLVKNW